MAVKPLFNQDWRRFHDAERQVIHPGATVHCVDGAECIIQLCADRAANVRFKAAGSHWALSEATVSDDQSIETNWPGTDNVPRHTGLDFDLQHLISDHFRQVLLDNPPKTPDILKHDPSLREGPGGAFYVHIKSGTRVYEAYSLLDRSPQVITQLAEALNAKLAGGRDAEAYSGPWAFETLGGAGGQTVFGALTTGTHGGDFLQRPIADSVAAVHLVTDGGAHFWIEPQSTRFQVQMTDDEKLHAHYSGLVQNAPFKVIRDDDVFNSVIVGGGRFGVVSSLVLCVVPQYSLHEHRRLDSGGM